MTEKTPSLFDQLYSATEAVIDMARKPLVKNAVKRKLEKAYDDAQDRINNATEAIHTARGKFKDYDVNKVLEQQGIIEQCNKLQGLIKIEYFTLFGVEMKTVNED